MEMRSEDISDWWKTEWGIERIVNMAMSLFKSDHSLRYISVPLFLIQWSMYHLYVLWYHFDHLCYFWGDLRLDLFHRLWLNEIDTDALCRSSRRLSDIPRTHIPDPFIIFIFIILYSFFLFIFLRPTLLFLGFTYYHTRGLGSLHLVITATQRAPALIFLLFYFISFTFKLGPIGKIQMKASCGLVESCPGKQIAGSVGYSLVII